MSFGHVAIVVPWYTWKQPIHFSAMQMTDEMTHQHHSLYFITFLYLADSFIQSDLDCIQCIGFCTFYQ